MSNRLWFKCKPLYKAISIHVLPSSCNESICNTQSSNAAATIKYRSSLAIIQLILYNLPISIIKEDILKIEWRFTKSEVPMQQTCSEFYTKLIEFCNIYQDTQINCVKIIPRPPTTLMSDPMCLVKPREIIAYQTCDVTRARDQIIESMGRFEPWNWFKYSILLCIYLWSIRTNGFDKLIYRQQTLINWWSFSW